MKLFIMIFSILIEFKHKSSKVLYESDDNVLVATPIGSGKTTCAEFAILRSHKKWLDSMRVVYVAPIEARAKKQHRDWEKKFGGSLKLRVVELNGETAENLELLEKGQIIISTPEKWDALSRCWKQRKHVQQVTLFIVDVLHSIGSQGGPILEVIISRMRHIASKVKNKIRIVALSTSLANGKDVGEWIGATSHGLFNFPPSARPVPLKIQIEGVEFTDLKDRRKKMTKISYTAITQHTKNGEPVLVFVPTGDHAEMTATNLLKYSKEDGNGEKSFLFPSKIELEHVLEKISDDMLRDTLRKGVGYLHEDLNSCDHEIVSQLFKDGLIHVCVLSSSMCWGVTLSSHLVVVMGTQHYNGSSRYSSPTDLLQMMGQARCPFVDSSGKCVILCHDSHKLYYKTFLCEAFPLESNLHHFLHDNLNAEIVAGIIEKRQDAVDYLTWTFMYRRLTHNPNYYNLEGVTQTHVLSHMSELVARTVNELEANGCVDVVQDHISPTDLGRIASDYHISYKTIGRFSQSLNAESDLQGILEVLSFSSEYDGLPIRLDHEEEEMSKLINQRRFAYENGKVTNPWVKANALLQAHFSRLMVGSNLLALDQKEVLRPANILIQALIQLASKREWLNVTLDLVLVNQMLTVGLWENDCWLLQLPYFSKDLANKCNDMNMKGVEDLLKMDVHKKRALLTSMSDVQLLDIDKFLRRFPSPKLSLKIQQDERFGNLIYLHVNIKLEEDADKKGIFWLLVGDSDGHLVAIKSISAHSIGKKTRVNLEFVARSGMTLHCLYLVCDSYMGIDQSHHFNVRRNGD